MRVEPDSIYSSNLWNLAICIITIVILKVWKGEDEYALRLDKKNLEGNSKK